MKKLKALLFLLQYFTYIIRLALSKHKGIYLLIISSFISIGLEFFSIFLISQPPQTNEIKIPFIPYFFSNHFTPIIFSILLTVRFISLAIIDSTLVYYAKELQVFFYRRGTSKFYILI
ncbi:MAG: hypothetical protein IPL26_13530 [Leptospiraceae bacterium]|nr:hypothetical protein [Leptospiraceae bacterium]